MKCVVFYVTLEGEFEREFDNEAEAFAFWEKIRHTSLKASITCNKKPLASPVD